MNASNLSPAAADLLARLRNSVESREDGFGEVYLDNANVNSHRDAGLLSALTKAGLYRRMDSFFGMVKLAEVAQVETEETDEFSNIDWQPSTEPEVIPVGAGASLRRLLPSVR